MPLRQHPHRAALVNELHARPLPRVAAPFRLSHLVFAHGPEEHDAAAAHIADLCERCAAPPPPTETKHHWAACGAFSVKWERHSEFTAVTLFAAATDPKARPFSHPAASLAPEGWLAAAPGEVIAALHIEGLARAQDEAALPDDIAPYFDPESLTGGVSGSNAMRFWGDFRIHEDGFSRFLVEAAPESRPESLGRLCQRLMEIETYRAASMLALPHARGLWPELNRIDAALAEAAGSMVGAHEAEREMLDRITGLSAEIETITAAQDFRLSAARAYETIVWSRIEAIDPRPIAGVSRLSAFMSRRYDPAMRTCRSTSERLQTLSDRASRAAELLRTRIDVSVEEQNRELLKSMNRRAEQQLRLQETVEGLSVVAISYYAVSLGAYLLGPVGKETGLGETWLKALLVAPVAAAVWWFLRRMRRR